jgi:uncharacterized protein YndB with AHSA1/START domain
VATRSRAAIEISTVIPAPPQRVWEDIRHIGSHVEWMEDAVAIRFQSDQRQGVGTTFETATKVGPFRLTDVMVVTEWEPAQVMGIRHVGLVTGTGRFTLVADGDDATRFTWTEELHFPWWMAGTLGAAAGRPVLTAVWHRNLANLRRRFEG